MSEPRIIATQTIAVQTSANYDSQTEVRTLVIDPAMTVKELIEWSQRPSALYRGQVTLSIEDREGADPPERGDVP